MSVIYMKHPQHGTKVAIAESEAVADEANGWMRFDVTAHEMPVDAPKSVPEDIHDIDTLRAKYETRFGKPPDMRWKASTLLMELA